MLRREAIALDEEELLELRMILIDQDEAEAFRFLKKSVYDKVVQAERNRLKCHLDGGGDLVEAFKTR